MTQKAIDITERMYEIRDTMRDLLGEKYPAHLEQAKEILRLSATRTHGDHIFALMRVLSFAKTLPDPDGAAATGMAVAAHLEMIESGEIQ